jgi:ABC-2 type transport system ATP-binding protein
MTTDLVIACEGLTKRYRRGLNTFTAVEELNLEVPRGATFGLLGPNGAGKTTTISMLLGVVRPSAGGARLLGRPIGESAARRRIGYVPEKFQLPPFLTAREFLTLHGRLFGLSGPDLARRVESGLERVGLAGRGGDRAGGFSKGMQQRLVLAQALLADPELLILDEPTSALDPVGRKEVRDIITEAHGRGTTVLLNSHILAEVEAVCDQVAVLRGGKLIRQGTVRALADGALEVEARIGGYGPAVAEALAPHVQALRLAPASSEPWATIHFELGDEDLLPIVAATVIGAGGALYALTPRRESLEDLFMRLVEQPR